MLKIEKNLEKKVFRRSPAKLVLVKSMVPYILTSTVSRLVNDLKPYIHRFFEFRTRFSFIQHGLSIKISKFQLERARPMNWHPHLLSTIAASSFDERTETPSSFDYCCFFFRRTKELFRLSHFHFHSFSIFTCFVERKTNRFIQQARKTEHI